MLTAVNKIDMMKEKAEETAYLEALRTNAAKNTSHLSATAPVFTPASTTTGPQEHEQEQLTMKPRIDMESYAEEDVFVLSAQETDKTVGDLTLKDLDQHAKL